MFNTGRGYGVLSRAQTQRNRAIINMDYFLNHWDKLSSRSEVEAGTEWGWGGENEICNVLTKIRTSPDPSEGKEAFLGEFRETKVFGLVYKDLTL